MKHVVLASAFSLGLAVQGCDFAGGLALRGVKLGDTCESAAQHEISGGARAETSVETMLKNAVLGFYDESVPTEPKRIIYGCDDSGLVRNYEIRTTLDPNEAYRLYATEKSRFIAKYGLPQVDSDSFSDFQMKMLLKTYSNSVSQWRDLDGEKLSLFQEIPVVAGKITVSLGVGKHREHRKPQ